MGGGKVPAAVVEAGGRSRKTKDRVTMAPLEELAKLQGSRRDVSFNLEGTLSNMMASDSQESPEMVRLYPAAENFDAVSGFSDVLDLQDKIHPRSGYSNYKL